MSNFDTGIGRDFPSEVVGEQEHKEFILENLGKMGLDPNWIDETIKHGIPTFAENEGMVWPISFTGGDVEKQNALMSLRELAKLRQSESEQK